MTYVVLTSASPTLSYISSFHAIAQFLRRVTAYLKYITILPTMNCAMTLDVDSRITPIQAITTMAHMLRRCPKRSTQNGAACTL